MMRFMFTVCAALFALTALATDYACVEECVRQGNQYSLCKTTCSRNPGPMNPQGMPYGSGMQNQGGLPRNPGFDTVRPEPMMQQPQPRRVEPKCLSDCRGRGYNYTYCRQACSY